MSDGVAGKRKISGGQGWGALATTLVCVTGIDDVEEVDSVEDEGGSVSTLNGAGDGAWSPFGRGTGVCEGVVVICIEGR